jgi:NADPH-dependent 2,4-dienoyl-CoA reductase/sulfur reductase-like enzyme
LDRLLNVSKARRYFETKLGETSRKIILGIILTASVAFVAARPYQASEAQHFTRLRDIADSYDYVIIGGGTAGLMVADRLAEDGQCVFCIF